MPSCHPGRKHYAKNLCDACYKKNYYHANRDKIRTYTKKYYLDNRARLLAYSKAYGKNYYKEYAIKNKDTINTRQRITRQKRRNTDLQYKLRQNLRSRLSKAIVRETKTGSAINDLGCSMTMFKLYIENQFTEGMTWDNYGEWHLDHVLPLMSFDLSNRSEFQVAVHYLNIQPLWARDNIHKGRKIGA